MNNRSYIIPFLLLFLLVSCKKEVEAPRPYGPVPTEAQMNWQKLEYYMFIHFGPNTFTDVEWGNGKEDPKVFNPTDLDCRQWASIAKDAGMKGIIITAKHHDGFCLWPSEYSTHTVRESLWKDGKGDILKELSEACKEFDLKFGVYLSPWDQNHPDYGTDKYNEVFANTLTEVLTNYGDVFEQWFDGANGEGANGKKQVYDWELFNGVVAKKQPHAIIFSDIGPGCRWIGNEEGHIGETNWSRLDTDGFQPGRPAPALDTLNQGNIHGKYWVPGETNTSIRPGWFYSPSTDDKVKSLAELVDIYYTSVARNSNLLLNVPPDRTGRIHKNDSIRLMEFRRIIDKSFEKNLAKGSVTANHTRGGSSKFSAKNVLDSNYETYWTTDDNVLNASLELVLDQPETFNRLLLQEYIPLGQRIASFDVEFWNEVNNSWQLLTEATTVGYKRILSFPSVTTNKIRVNIKNSLACPIISSLELYNAPDVFNNRLSVELDGAISTEGWTLISPKEKAIIDQKLDLSVSVPIKEAIVIDLGKEIKLDGFFYIPENQVGTSNVMRYNFFVSNDGKQWRTLKTNERFNNIENNPIRQDVRFEKPVNAHFLKFEPTELVQPLEFYKIVELGIIQSK